MSSTTIQERQKERLSTNHIGWQGDCEFLVIADGHQDQVLRAHCSNSFVHATGNRLGRFECSVAHFLRYRDTCFPGLVENPSEGARFLLAKWEGVYDA